MSQEKYLEHFEAAEKALEGAKELMRRADGSSGSAVRTLHDSAAMLLSVASVHTGLARASR